MARARVGLVGEPGSLEWTRIELNGDGWPNYPTKCFAYSVGSVMHPYRGYIHLTLCAEIDPAHKRRGNAIERYVSYKTFNRDYLRSGKRLYIYCSLGMFNLQQEIICLDFISDILGKITRHRITEAKRELEALASQTLRDDGRATTDDGVVATDDENGVDYY